MSVTYYIDLGRTVAITSPGLKLLKDVASGGKIKFALSASYFGSNVHIAPAPVYAVVESGLVDVVEGYLVPNRHTRTAIDRVEWLKRSRGRAKRFAMRLSRRVPQIIRDKNTKVGYKQVGITRFDVHALGGLDGTNYECKISSFILGDLVDRRHLRVDGQDLRVAVVVHLDELNRVRHWSAYSVQTTYCAEIVESIKSRIDDLLSHLTAEAL